jgi:hypothetical protein
MNVSNHTLAENTMFQFRPLMRQNTFVETSLNNLLPKENKYLSNNWSIGDCIYEEEEEQDTLPKLTIEVDDLDITIKKKEINKHLSLFNYKNILEIKKNLKKRAHSSNTYTFKNRYNV